MQAARRNLRSRSSGALNCIERTINYDSSSFPCVKFRDKSTRKETICCYKFVKRKNCKHQFWHVFLCTIFCKYILDIGDLISNFWTWNITLFPHFENLTHQRCSQACFVGVGCVTFKTSAELLSRYDGPLAKDEKTGDDIIIIINRRREIDWIH